MFDRRLVKYFNWRFLLLILLLSATGLLALYSASGAGGDPHQKVIYYKQLIWFGIGFLLMAVSFFFDYKMLEKWAYPLYGGCLVLLMWVLLFGRYVSGSRRWIDLGPASFQPSEVAKIAVIIVLARYYSKVIDVRGLTFRELIKPALLVGIPFLLILKQPDLGTAGLVLLIAASITFFVKIERRTLLCLLGLASVSTPLVWFSLRGYQKQRILTFLDPDRDPLGTGYHIIQSKIAIGSGMLTGKGLFKGTQNVLSFLPEQHTDFIFSVYAEEWGFVGCLFLILTLMILILWGLNIAYECREPFGVILCVGVTAMIFWQVVINIGMVMGLFPVVGVTLPFISYGGSSILTILLCVSILLNISMRRFSVE